MADATAQFAKFKQLIATAELPRLGPQGRAGTVTEEELARQLAAFFASEKISPRIQPLLRSAALLWHDHLDASHIISQGIETPEGSWLHGIMHRREPDYGNAKYWFRRVGQHEAFPKLAERVCAVAASRESAADQKLDGRALTKRGYSSEWDPFAFIDECDAAEQGKDEEIIFVLRQIQAAEFDGLVEHILSQA